MVFNPAQCTAETLAAMQAAFPDAFPDGGEAAKGLDVLCTSILAHIAANGTVAVISVTGVTVGAGVSGVGTGTIS